MEKKLFNLYLKYIEGSCPSVWKRLGKIPTKLKVYLFCIIGFYLASITPLFFGKYFSGVWSLVATVFTIVSTVLCIISEVLLFFGIEKYEIDASEQSMKEYWEYCYGVRQWFQKNFLSVKRKKEKDISDEISEVKRRIDIYLKNQSEINDKRNGRIDKLVQALAIPFILAIITSVLEKNEQPINAISEIITIIIILAIIVGGIWVINSFYKLFKKQEIEQMKCFSEDLQGALDCVTYAAETQND